MISSKVLYDTRHYSVHVLTEQVIDEKAEMPPLSYGLLNKMTGKVETLSTFLPAAIETAVGLSDKLEELLPEDSTIIQFSSDMTLN